MATAVVAPNSSGSFSHAYDMPDRLTGDLATLGFAHSIQANARG